MANFAKLGGAVFYGDYMFSQSGTINGTEVSGVDAEGKAYYRQFTDGVTYGTFLPYLMLNFKTGELNAEKGKFKGTIEALKGSIGGFEIAEGRIGVSSDGSDYNVGNDGMGLYPSYILFRSSSNKTFTAVGSNVLPLSAGMPANARFEHNEESYGTNYGVIIDVSGGMHNLAISAKGNIVSNNLNTEYGLKVITLSATTVTHEQYDQSTYLIKSTVDSGHICLPDRGEVQNALGIGSSGTFCVSLRIIADASCTKNFKIQGRNTAIYSETNGVKKYFLDKDIYPYRLDNNANQQLTDGLSMAASDVAEYQLVYDGTTYNAYLVNLKQ